MIKLIRSLKLIDRIAATGKDKQTKCEKCGKRQATKEDGLCDHCRFGSLLAEMARENRP